MPIYEYQCTDPDCGEQVELFTAMIERNNHKNCDRCGGWLTRKLTGPARVWAPTRNMQ